MAMRWTIFSALLFFWISVPGYADTPSDALAPVCSAEVSVDMALPDSILTYEPLVFSATVSNHQDQRVYLPSPDRHVSPDDPRFMVFVKKPGSDRYETFHQLFIQTMLHLTPIPLEKGEASYPVLIVALTGPEWELPFDKTGVYEIKVRSKLMREDEDGRVSKVMFAESEPMPILIQEPKGDDAAAMALWGIGMTRAYTICESGQTLLGQKKIC